MTCLHKRAALKHFCQEVVHWPSDAVLALGITASFPAVPAASACSRLLRRVHMAATGLNSTTSMFRTANLQFSGGGVNAALYRVGAAWRGVRTDANVFSCQRKATAEYLSVGLSVSEMLLVLLPRSFPGDGARLPARRPRFVSVRHIRVIAVRGVIDVVARLMTLARWVIIA